MTNDPRFKIEDVVFCFDLNLMPIKAKVTVIHVWRSDGQLIRVVYDLMAMPLKINDRGFGLTKDERQVFKTVEEMKKAAYEEALLLTAMTGNGKSVNMPGIYSGAMGTQGPPTT